MALLGNGFRETLTGRMFGSTLLNGATPHVHEYRGHIAARMRNQFAGEGIAYNKASVPSGARHPVAWVMASKNGAMSSRNVTGMSIGASGLAVGGITATGNASISIDFSPATAALIASGAGNASLVFTVADALLTASIAGAGSASFTFSATAPPGALASGYGTAGMLITLANAQPYPLNDASPLRTGAASFAITGSLVPYAIGVMGGSTDNNTVLTTSAIASEVWSTLAASFTTVGTMGNKINSAASGGVDYTALGVAVWNHLLTNPSGGSAGAKLSQVLTTGNFLALKD